MATMVDLRIKALAEFLNDTPVTKELGLYIWRGKYYQVLPYKGITKLGMKKDSFIKYTYAGNLYGIREMSKDLLKKWFKITS